MERDSARAENRYSQTGLGFSGWPNGLSDVKFIVPVSNGESESKVIPAHKLVLAIGSSVFYAMFYGQMADTRDSIELPDCDYESLLELFRFIYSDEVELTGGNVSVKSKLKHPPRATEFSENFCSNSPLPWLKSCSNAPS